MRKGRLWLAALLAGVILAGPIPAALGNDLSITLEVEEPEVSLAVSPSALTFSMLSWPEPREFLEEIQLTNSGNVPIQKIEGTVDLSRLQGVNWQYVSTTSTLGKDQFNVAIKSEPDSFWHIIPDSDRGWVTIVSTAIHPEQTVPMALRLATGSNLSPGQATFHIKLRVIT